MEGIDYQYYRTFDWIARPFYDWERQIVNLGCNLADVRTPKGEQYLSIFIHEYIHFLQNFATAWGAPVFTDFSLALLKIGASSALSKDILRLPLNVDLLNNGLLKDGFVLRRTVIARIEKCGSSTSDENGTLKAVELSLSNSCANLSNGRVTVEVGGKVIREHMAYLGTQLFLKKDDVQIHDHNKTMPGFHLNGIEFSQQSEYWIVYEYFFSSTKYQNLAKGIFHLMQHCLITLNPERAFLRFATWFTNNKGQYFPNESFIKLGEDWLDHGDEVYHLDLGYKTSVEHCERILALAEKHQDEHHSFLFTHSITEYALNNIKATSGGRLLFRLTDDLTDIAMWKRKIAKFGTGLVKYLDGVKVHGTKEHCEKMPSSFYFLLSCSLVLKKVIENQRATCPFLYDLPICEAPFKENDSCFHNPFEVIQEDNKGKHCLFRNGVLLMGLQDRIFFDH